MIVERASIDAPWKSEVAYKTGREALAGVKDIACAAAAVADAAKEYKTRAGELVDAEQAESRAREKKRNADCRLHAAEDHLAELLEKSRAAR